MDATRARALARQVSRLQDTLEDAAEQLATIAEELKAVKPGKPAPPAGEDDE